MKQVQSESPHINGVLILPLAPLFDAQAEDNLIIICKVLFMLPDAMPVTSTWFLQEKQH